MWISFYPPQTRRCLPSTLPPIPESRPGGQQSQQFGTPGSRFKPPLLPAPWRIEHARLYDGIALSIRKVGRSKDKYRIQRSNKPQDDGIFKCAIAAQIRPVVHFDESYIGSHLLIIKSPLSDYSIIPLTSRRPLKRLSRHRGWYIPLC